MWKRLFCFKNSDYEKLFTPDFYLIDGNGHHYNREEVIANHQPLLNFDSFKMTSVSQTKLISYELGRKFHTSICVEMSQFMITNKSQGYKDEKVTSKKLVFSAFK